MSPGPSRSRTRCPNCSYGLDGHTPGEAGRVRCPECGERSALPEILPRTAPRWPIWRCGTIPAAIIGVPIALAWLYALLIWEPFSLNLPWIALTVLAALPGWPAAAAGCVVAVVARARQVDAGHRWRVAMLGTAVLLAWVAPVFSVAYWTVRETAAVLASV